MDEHNIHQFWGTSPGLDLTELAVHSEKNDEDVTELGADNETAFRVLQVACNDCRHTINTMSRFHRHSAGALELYVYEEELEVLARHMLLVAVLLDDQLLVRDRVETFLELHGNLFIQEKTASYLDAMGRRLEAFVADYGLGKTDSNLASLFDLSLLNYKEKDALIDQFKNYRKTVKYDAAKALDARHRKIYGDRFDYHKNMIDWDYHMRLSDQGNPGRDKADGSVIHFYHFRHWRFHGVAYEFRDCVYKEPNRSLLSTAYGRTKEFKDRYLKDVGRSVAAWGFWGDVLNSPYHSFGTVCEEDSFFKRTNKQFTKTAVDIAEFNVTAIIEELRTGRRYELPVNAKKDTTEGNAIGEQATSSSVQEEANSDPANETECGKAVKSEGEVGRSDTQGPSNSVSDDPVTAPDTAAQSVQDEQAGESGSSALSGLGGESHLEEGTGGSVACASGEAPGCDLVQKENERAADNLKGAIEEVRGPTDHQGCGSKDKEDLDEAQESHRELEERERELNEAAWDRCKNSKIILMTGDFKKRLTGKQRFSGFFDVLCVGNRQVHYIGKEWGLRQTVKPGVSLAVENAKYILQLKKDQVNAFTEKVRDLGKEAGWKPAFQSFNGILNGALDAFLPFKNE